MENHEIYEALTFSACSDNEQKIILRAIKLEHDANYIRKCVESLGKSFAEIEALLFEKLEDLIPGEEFFFWQAVGESGGSDESPDFDSYKDACIVYRDLISEKYKNLKPTNIESPNLFKRNLLYLKNIAAI